MAGCHDETFAGRADNTPFSLTGVLTRIEQAATATGVGYSRGELTLPWNAGVVERVPVIVHPFVYRTAADLIAPGVLLHATGVTLTVDGEATFSVHKARAGQYWWDITPVNAMKLDLHKRHDIVAPLNELGERCPWPWDPQQLAGVADTLYPCWYCGAICVAGAPHRTYETTGQEAPDSPAPRTPRREPTK